MGISRLQTAAAACLILWSIGSQDAFAIRGACGDRPLPSGKTRKLDRSSVRLLCTSGVDYYIRGPQAIPEEMFEKWLDLNHANSGSFEDRLEMQKVLQELPKIRWSGRIPYSTIETWDWVDWVYGQHPSCPPETEEYQETEYYTDSEGNQKSRTVTKKRQVMGTCWHDEDRTEYRHCSDEVMTYAAGYERPSLSEWKPDPEIEGYYDVIPNKYDLLPGEVESVEVVSNNSRSASVSPFVRFGDAWNEYDPEVEFRSGGTTKQCRMNSDYHIDVVVRTVRRLIKRSPNAFRMPLDEYGEMSPELVLGWTESQDSKGRFVRSGFNQIRLTDISDVLIRTMAAQTRKSDADRVAAKSEAGTLGEFEDEEIQAQSEKSGFWQDTHVRVQLWEVVGFARDRKVSQTLYNRGANVAMGDQYRIRTDGNTEGDDLFRMSGLFLPDSLWSRFSVALRPYSNYELKVSMYQKGVPFYTPDCETKGGVDCFFGVRTESDWYSKPLNIPFETESYDRRGWFQKLNDFQSDPLHRKLRFWRYFR